MCSDNSLQRPTIGISGQPSTNTHIDIEPCKLMIEHCKHRLAVLPQGLQTADRTQFGVGFPMRRHGSHNGQRGYRQYR